MFPNFDGEYIISKNVFSEIGGVSNYEEHSIFMNSHFISYWERNETELTYNSFLNSTGPLGFFVCLCSPYCTTVNTDITVSMENNYWSTKSASTISSKIYDYYDDFTTGKVDFEPFLTEPSPNAPPQIVSVTTNPAGQLGVGEVEFTITFNCDMDPSTEALVAFGPAEPYTDHQITGSLQDAKSWMGKLYHHAIDR